MRPWKPPWPRPGDWTVPWHRAAVRPDPGSAASWRLVEQVLDPWLARQLQDIHVGLPPGTEPAPTPLSGHPLLLVANHTSWFDGFLLRRVQRALAPGATLRTLMLSRELKGWRGGRPVLRQLGGTGFDPRRPMTLRAALRSLEPARRTTAGLAVAFFPQGKIYPSYRKPPGFQPGLRLVMSHLAPATVLPVGIHLETGRHVRPSAWILSGPALAVEPGQIPSVVRVESAVEDLCQRIRSHLASWGEEAEAHWPPAAPGD
ncbi:MAG: 1-acyl-sn-glycerol-3-phosphate acyltransferase [Gemmatimonadales bacterium]|nr:MAG: 1-acyl-sn-glycerol-3-phosphate acyltransferase [Gemmatimonadales bacterium]